MVQSPINFTITDVLEQDMGLANDAARQFQTPLPLGEAARDIYNIVVERQPELTKKDFSSVYRFLQGRQKVDTS